MSCEDCDKKCNSHEGTIKAVASVETKVTLYSAGIGLLFTVLITFVGFTYLSLGLHEKDNAQTKLELYKKITTTDSVVGHLHESTTKNEKEIDKFKEVKQ